MPWRRHRLGLRLLCDRGDLSYNCKRAVRQFLGNIGYLHMSLPTLAASTPIQLQFASGQISVPIEDQDRFVVASQRAVSVSEHSAFAGQSSKLFADKFLAPIREWCLSLGDRVGQCYVPFELTNNFITVFMVRRALKFDFVLSEAIADLDGKLIRDGWPCEVLQLGLQRVRDCTSSSRLRIRFRSIDHSGTNNGPMDNLKDSTMGTAAEHDEKARHHLQFLGEISDQYPDWLATVAFYAAVELVERLFAQHRVHSRGHEDRNQSVQRRYPSIAAAYKAPLQCVAGCPLSGHEPLAIG